MSDPRFIVIRLAPEAYQQLARKFGACVVTKDTTDLQAGYMLGVKAVLDAVREGFTIEE